MESTIAKFTVIVTDDRHAGEYSFEREQLARAGAELLVRNCQTPEEVIAECQDADGLLVNLAPITRDVVQALPKCKIISRYGVGYDNVDVPACTERGILFTYVPDFCAEDVSDHALALLLSCVRRTARRDAQVRAGLWNIGRTEKLYRMQGKTFVFLGFGQIAKALRRKLSGFGFSRFLAYDHKDAETLAAFGVTKVSWEQALAEADYLSVHIPLRPENINLLNTDAFSLMKPTAILLNTARGPIIDECALATALQSGALAYAGIDVYAKEPIERMNPLLSVENCVLTDHTGWYTEESFVELKTKASNNIAEFLLGNPPPYPVNKI